MADSILDSQAVRTAFLGPRVGALFELIVSQGDDVLRAEGLSFPSRAASTIFLIDELDGVTIADITRELNQTHQLVAQRVDLLISAGLVERASDPQDGRRKLLKLTRKGRKEASQLKAVLFAAAQAYDEIFKELGVDYLKLTQQIISLIERKPLHDRIQHILQAPKRAAS